MDAKATVKISWNQKALEKLTVPAERALVKCGLMIEADVKKSFTSGGMRQPKRQALATGRLYWGKKNSRGVRQGKFASAEGQPPAVDTGRLRASITTNWSRSNHSTWLAMTPVAASVSSDGIKEPSGGADKFTVVVGTNVEYAPYLEFGTRKMYPRPYLSPAYERMKSRIASILAREGSAASESSYGKGVPER